MVKSLQKASLSVCCGLDLFGSPADGTLLLLLLQPEGCSEHIPMAKMSFSL